MGGQVVDECDWIIEGRELQAENVRILVLWLVNGNNSRWTIGERMVEGVTVFSQAAINKPTRDRPGAEPCVQP